MYSAAFSTFLKKIFYGQYLLKYSATFSNLLKLSHAFLVLSTELNGSSYIPLPFQFFLNFFTNFWLFQFKLICSSTLLVFLKLFIDSSWYIPLPFQLCWNYFTNFSFLHIFGHNNPSSISAAFSKLELFHEFLVISTEDDMFHYLFGFLKTFYTFLVLSIQTETLRYLFNFVETFFGYSTLSYHQSAKILGCILVTIKNWNYCSNSSTNNEKYWYV